MMDWICVPEPRQVASAQHSEAQVALLAHVKEVFAETACREKYVPAHGMGSTHKSRSNVDASFLWSALAHDVILADVDEWNANRGHAGMIEFGKCLFHGSGGNK